jgi:hypothetical protein
LTAEYAEPFALYDFALYEATNDYIRNGSIYASENGTDWKKIAAIGTNFTSESVGNANFYVIRGNAEGMMVKYIKFATESTANAWTQLFEFEFNKTTGEAEGTLPAFSAVRDGVPQNMIDGILNTAFTTTSDEPYLDYTVSENANATSLCVLQGSLDISNAKVLVKMAGNDEWLEIGTLSNAYNEIALPEGHYGISNIRFEWAENGAMPRIYEIYTLTAIDKADLSAAIVAAKAAEQGTNALAYAQLQLAIAQAEAVFDDALASEGMIIDAIAALNQWLAALNEACTIQYEIESGKLNVNVGNFADTAKTVNIIVTVYDEAGRLVDIENVQRTIEVGGEGTLTFDRVAEHEGYIFKVFAWETGSFVPLSNALDGRF